MSKCYIEEARKAAGISGMTKNYPDDPKQRGAGYWAAFVGALSTTLYEKDAELLALQKTVAALENQLRRKS